MRELSLAEQRYLAVLAVIAEGHDVTAVAQRWGVSGQTVHDWLSRYEVGARGPGGSLASAAVVPASDAGRDRGVGGAGAA